MMYPKPTPIISKKIRQSAKDESCTLRLVGICNGNRETTVFAHINSARKGIGNKSLDLHGVYACNACHSALDAGKVDALDQLRALIETQIRLVQKGLIGVEK